jgi:hypothetical protein
VLDRIACEQSALSLAGSCSAERNGLGVPVSLDGFGDGLDDELMRLVARARSGGLDSELELRAAGRLAARVREWEQAQQS